MSTLYSAVTPKSYVSPLPTGNFTFLSASKIYPYQLALPGRRGVNVYTGEVYKDSSLIESKKYIVTVSSLGLVVKTEGDNDDFNLYLTSGNYEVKYSYFVGSDENDPLPSVNKTATYHFAVVENHYPLKKMTVKEVIERQIAISEPLMVFAYTPEYGRIASVQPSGLWKSRTRKSPRKLSPRYIRASGERKASMIIIR